jgi:ribosomal-protein-alanine N-acetyltransferase
MFKSEAIHIAELKIEDARALFELMDSNREHFGSYLPITLSQNKSIIDSETYILKKAKENKLMSCLTLAIRDEASMNIAGLIILKNIDRLNKRAEFAYGVGMAFEGRGLTSGAVEQLSHYAFAKLDLTTLQIIVHKDNIASCKVAIKCGFQWKRTLKKEFTPPNGKPLDMELYELYR